MKNPIYSLAEAYCRTAVRLGDKRTSAQDKTFRELLEAARHTQFGRKHYFNEIENYADFRQAVPLVSYEELKPYIERMIAGEEDVLWPGRPAYFAKSSGTTSGQKFIPVTKESLKNQINVSRRFLFNYLARYKQGQILGGTTLFISESHKFEDVGGIPTAPISAITSFNMPAWAENRCIPTRATSREADFEEKIRKLVKESLGKNIQLLVGMPPWLLLYLRELNRMTGGTAIDAFPKLTTLFSSGMSYEPYAGQMEHFLGKKLDVLEAYPASEGNIAYQDLLEAKGMRLATDQGIFFEFVPVEDLGRPNPRRYSLAEVVLDVNYALILNTNAGLWGYIIGDTVRFVSLDPPRLLITGRTKQFISVFGEHLVVEDTDESLSRACAEHNVRVAEYTVAARLFHDRQLAYHEWFIEFDEPPADMQAFAARLDELLCKRNFCYDDLVVTHAIKPLKIRPVRKNGFLDYMKAAGMAGAQRKFPRLQNDRRLADGLEAYCLPEE